jgi:hypothetical protein
MGAGVMAPRPGTTFKPTPPQGGKGGGAVQPTQPPYTPIGLPPAQIPAQGGKGNRPLPADYQSQYGNYGFDTGLQNYLDNQYIRSTTDMGTNFQYNPTTQTFTGGTMGGQYNPIPLNVMQQAAGGNQNVLNSYFQPRFPQTATQPQRDLGYGNQLPQGMPRPVSIQPQRDLGYGNPPPRPQVPMQDAIRGAFLNVAPGSPTGYPTQQVRPAPQPVRPAPAPVQTRGPVTRNMQPAATQGLAALMNRRR